MDTFWNLTASVRPLRSLGLAPRRPHKWRSCSFWLPGPSSFGAPPRCPEPEFGLRRQSAGRWGSRARPAAPRTIQGKRRRDPPCGRARKTLRVRGHAPLPPGPLPLHPFLPPFSSPLPAPHFPLLSPPSPLLSSLSVPRPYRPVPPSLTLSTLLSPLLFPF